MRLLESGISPFGVIADPSFFYEDEARTTTRGELRAALSGGAGIAVLVGEPGTGKSAMLHRVMADLETAGLACLTCPMPVSAEELRARLPAPAAHRRVAVALDEAQALDAEVLSGLPGLLAERPDAAVLLAGDSGLEAALAQAAGGTPVPVALRCRVGPFKTRQVRAYLEHRWKAAGGATLPFGDGAIRRIAAISEGAPQVIDVLAGRAVQLAEHRGITWISDMVIDEVARDFAPPERRRFPTAQAAAVVVPILLVGAGALWLWTSGGRSGTMASAPRVESRPEAPAPRRDSGGGPADAQGQRAPAGDERPGRPTADGGTAEKSPAVSEPTAREPAAPADARATAAVSPPAVPPAAGERRPDAVASTFSSDTMLLRRAEEGDAAEVSRLLDEGASPNARDASGFTPLMLAVIQDQPAVADTLLARGAAVNARSRAGLTPLMLAAINDRADTLPKLVGRGGDVNARTKAGWTALTYAAWRGHPRSVRLLLAAGANPNVFDRDGWSILEYAKWRAAEPTAADDALENAAGMDAARGSAAAPARAEVIDLLRQGGATR